MDDFNEFGCFEDDAQNWEDEQVFQDGVAEREEEPFDWSDFEDEAIVRRDDEHQGYGDDDSPYDNDRDFGYDG